MFKTTSTGFSNRLCLYKDANAACTDTQHSNFTNMFATTGAEGRMHNKIEAKHGAALVRAVKSFSLLYLQRRVLEQELLKPKLL